MSTKSRSSARLRPRHVVAGAVLAAAAAGALVFAGGAADAAWSPDRPLKVPAATFVQPASEASDYAKRSDAS